MSLVNFVKCLSLPRYSFTHLNDIIADALTIRKKIFVIHPAFIAVIAFFHAFQVLCLRTVAESVNFIFNSAGLGYGNFFVFVTEVFDHGIESFIELIQ